MGNSNNELAEETPLGKQLRVFLPQGYRKRLCYMGVNVRKQCESLKDEICRHCPHHNI